MSTPQVVNLVNHLALFDKDGLSELRAKFPQYSERLIPGSVWGEESESPDKSEEALLIELIKLNIKSSSNVAQECLDWCTNRIQNVKNINMGSRICALVGGAFAAAFTQEKLLQIDWLHAGDIVPLAGALAAIGGGLVPIISDHLSKTPTSDKSIQEMFAIASSVRVGCVSLQFSIQSPSTQKDREHLDNVLLQTQELVTQITDVALSIGLAKISDLVPE